MFVKLKEALNHWIAKDPITGHRRLVVFLSKPWVIIMLTFFIICCAMVLSVNQIMMVVLHSKPEVVVPSIEKKGVTDAMRIAAESGLALQYDGVDFDEGVPAGTIIRQTPPAGIKVRMGRAIRVTISKGGQAIFVPSVEGKLLAEAQSNLGMEGLQVGGVNEVYHETIDEGYVVSQFPSSGTVVTRGTLVDLEVSKGAPPVGLPVVPNFIGRTFDEVKAWAEPQGVKVDVKEDARSVGQSGTVVQQNPVEGQPILPRENLKVTIVPLLASQHGLRLSYTVPDDVRGAAEVRMVARDSRGESEVYFGQHGAGQAIEIPINVTSATRVRIYVNGLLKDERVLEP